MKSSISDNLLRHTKFDFFDFDLLTVSCAFHHFCRSGSFYEGRTTDFKIAVEEIYCRSDGTGYYFPPRKFCFTLLKTGDVRIYNRAEIQTFFDRTNFHGFSSKTDGYMWMNVTENVRQLRLRNPLRPFAIFFAEYLTL